MSTSIVDPVALPPGANTVSRIKNYHFTGDEVSIPGWVVDFDSFRRWTLSPDFPNHGRIDYVNDEIWADMTMEDLFLHNQIKARIALVLGPIIEAVNSGILIHDRMRLVNQAATISNEPDMAFAFWQTLQLGRLTTRASTPGRDAELVGAPDMVLEVVSDSSEQKGTVELMQQYALAGISEYWLVDVRKSAIRFEIHQLDKGMYQQVASDGWMKSQVFDRQFRLVRSTNPLGKPQFTLEYR